MIQGIIFDFNGTLFKDSDLQEKAWGRLLYEIHGRPIRPNEFQDHIHGRTNNDLMDFYLGKDADEARKIEIAAKKEVYYRDIVRENRETTHLVNGTEQLFDKLTERQIPFTIATASEIDNVAFYFDIFSLKKWFANPDAIVYVDGTFPGKPAPDIYWKAAEKISCEPKNCLVVEDSIQGLLSAELAGIGTLIAMDPAHDRSIIKENPSVKAIINDFIGFTERFL